MNDTGRAYAAVERGFLRLPDAARLRETHHHLTSEPHPAGSQRNRELAEWIAGQFGRAGMEDVQITAHEVLLPEARSISVELIQPRYWRAPRRERAGAESQGTSAPIDVAYHAYSASGEATAPVVYAGHGLPADYDWLQTQGIDVRGAIVLVRTSHPYTYRGYKAFLAQERGAAGILVFTDPSIGGSAAGTPYPGGPWGPDDRIERGSIAYDFLTPGDPLTPGWPSVAGAPRVARHSAALPAILSAPLSAGDTQPILEALGGPAAPAGWQGALPLTYRTGPGPARVRLRVEADEGLRPVWTVTGILRGRQLPEEIVIVGNHRDAWVYGGVDPSSGTAAMLELARSLGALVRTGWRPRRSILFASWDAEELALTSSTEWGEQHRDWLRDRGVAYLNVDSAASGSRFVAVAVPSLARTVADAAGAIRDPQAGIPVAALARQQRSAERGIALDLRDDSFVETRPGGGSDYTVFLNHLGIPIVDLAFDGPHGVYHSRYDTHDWIVRFGDPGFRYHAALVQLWGVLTLRLAEADALPFDPAASARHISLFAEELERGLRASGQPSLLARVGPVRSDIDELSAAAARFNHARARALARGDRSTLHGLNAAIRRFERAFIDPAGLPGRPWYKHLLHAPEFSYAPMVLPALTEAAESGSEPEFAAAVARLRAALRRAREVLE